MKYYTYFIDVSLMMQQLGSEVKKRNIMVVKEEIIDFGQIEEPIICNCAGLPSGKFNKDNTVFPTRGHFFMLNYKAGNKHLGYMIFTKVLQRNKEEYLNFLPKNQFVTEESPMALKHMV